MTSKTALMLTVLFVTLCGVSAFGNCEETPNVFCVLQAMLNPIKSLKCLQLIAGSFEQTTNNYYFSIGNCNKETPPTPATDVFTNIMRDILTSTTKIITACKINTMDLFSKSFWCPSKIIFEYIQLRLFLVTAVSAGSRLEQFNSCVASNVTEYIESFTDANLQLNSCIFKNQ